MVARLIAVLLASVAAVSSPATAQAPRAAAAPPAWSPVPADLAALLDRVTRRLGQAPLERTSEGGGGIRRHAVNGPRDTATAFYRVASEASEAIQWTRESVTADGCAGGRRRVTVLTFTAVSVPKRRQPRGFAWQGQRHGMCLGDQGPTEVTTHPLSGSDPAVLATARAVLQRLSQ